MCSQALRAAVLVALQQLLEMGWVLRVAVLLLPLLVLAPGWRLAGQLIRHEAAGQPMLGSTAGQQDKQPGGRCPCCWRGPKAARC